MSTSKHTPGPWVAKADRRKVDRPSWSIHANGPVAKAYPSDSTCTRQVAGIATRSYRHAECEANAHLIAAAPDMLEALGECKNELWDICHSSGDPEDESNMECCAVTYRQVVAAIRKAKGEA